MQYFYIFKIGASQVNFSVITDLTVDQGCEKALSWRCLDGLSVPLSSRSLPHPYPWGGECVRVLK